MAGRGVTVDFNANIARFTSAIDKATNDLSKFQTNSERISRNVNTALANIGIGLSAAGVVAFGKSVIDGLDKLNDLSKTTGIAVGTLSGLGVAAKQSGADLDSVAQAVSKLSVNIGKDGEKFRALGITAKDPLEAFKQLADIFVAIKDPQERAAVAAAALGKSWQGTAPLLSEGSAAIGRMVTEGEKASGVTKEMAEEADKFNDQLELMKAKLAGAAIGITGGLLPAMNSLLDKIRTASQSGGLFSFLNTSSKEEANAQATIDSLKTKVGTMKKLREELSAPTLANKLNNTLLGSLLSGGTSDIKTLNTQIAATENKIKYLKSLVKAENDKANKTANPDKPIAPPSNKAIKNFIGGGGEEQSAAKATLANSLKLFEETVAQEKAQLDSRNKIIELYNNQNVISIKDYYDARKVAQDDGLKNSLASYDKEITVLRNFVKSASKETDQIEATGKINALLDKKSKLIQDASYETVAASLTEQKAFEDLANKIGSVNAAVLEFEGHLREAALIRFDQSNDDLTKRFTAEGNSQALARLEILRNYTAAQAELNQITTDSGLVTSQLANEELRIDVARRTGAMTELGALQALGTERQKAVDQLSVFYQKYAEIAEVSGNPKLIQDAKNLESQLGSLAAQTDLVGQKFQTLFANSASNALVQFSQGTVSATGAFKLFANSIISELVRMTTQAAAMKLFGGLFGQGGGGSAGKTGLSILGSLLGAFGGGVGKVASVGKLGSSTFGQSLWPVPKFAKGGVFGSNVIPFAKGGIVDSPTSFKFASGGMMQNGLMGEAGPEAIMPLKRDSSGRLGVSAGGGGGSKSMVINYNPTVNIDSRSDRASIIQDMQRINKQGQADLVEKLTRQGAI